MDLWLPTAQLEDWPRLLADALASPKPAGRLPGRLLSTGPAYAWLKIGEGCRHTCAFCTIPSIRGALKSVKAETLSAEARDLLAQGVRELVLVAQDVTAWGTDFGSGQGRERGLVYLLAELAGLEGLAWLRLLYLYPSGVSPELLRLIKTCGPPLLPYLDIPLQHAHPDVLSRMGRPFAKDPRRVLDTVRGILPDAALRTTFIVGYPGESEAHFESLCRFVEESRFQHLGVFAYQAEDGTPAAALPDQVPEEVKQRRRETLMGIQAGISEAFLAAQVGRRLPVLVDAPHPDWPGLHQGRVWFQAPEVDGITYVSRVPGRHARRACRVRYCGKYRIRSHCPGLSSGVPPDGRGSAVCGSTEEHDPAAPKPWQAFEVRRAERASQGRSNSGEECREAH